MGIGYGITNTQAKQLEGVRWLVDDVSYRFASRNGSAGGEQPWFAGAEGLAYPLQDETGTTTLFAKFFKPSMATEKRMERMQWFIDQAVFDWAPELSAAPCRVVDTRLDGRPDGIAFEFCCVLSQAVPGVTWLDAKARIMEGTWTPNADERMRWVRHLVRSLAILERRGIRHGDVSPYNVMVDPSSHGGGPALRLIDFDGFAATDAGDLCYLLESEGGTIGTDGYCPPEFDAMRQRSVSCVEHKSDRFARDMLMLELILYDGSWEFDEPVSRYDRDHILALTRSGNLPPGLRHLGRANIFDLKEQTRPHSAEAAQQLGLALPPRRKHGDQHPTVLATSGLAARYAMTSMCACVLGLWIVISYHFARLLVPGTAEGFAYLGELLARLLLFTASLSVCAMLLASVTLPGDRAQRLQIGRFAVEIPRRRQRTRRGARITLPAGLKLCRAGVVLVVVVRWLMRFGAS